MSAVDSNPDKFKHEISSVAHEYHFSIQMSSWLQDQDTLIYSAEATQGSCSSRDKTFPSPGTAVDLLKTWQETESQAAA